MPALDIRDLGYLELVAELERRKDPDAQKLYIKYRALAEHLFSNELKAIDIGMLIRDDTLYTIHGASHIFEVLSNAGRLLGGNLAEQQSRHLYVLLCAICLHDYGNIDGRNDHEKRPGDFIIAHPDLFDSSYELQRSIVEVAQAHGGKTEGGLLDTITGVSMGPEYQTMAAVLRLADELADNSDRTYPALLERGLIPAKSLHHHLYCKAIKLVRIRDSDIELQIIFDEGDLDVDRAQDGKTFLEFVDYRLAKTQMELALADRYFWPKLPRRTAGVRLGVHPTGMAVTPDRLTDRISFEPLLRPVPSFVAQCTQLHAQGISSTDELYAWLRGRNG